MTQNSKTTKQNNCLGDAILADSTDVESPKNEMSWTVKDRDLELIFQSCEAAYSYVAGVLSSKNLIKTVIKDKQLILLQPAQAHLQ